MMRLVLVHGMRQEGKDQVALRKAWETALTDAWKRLGLQIPAYDLDMPFYGDELDKLTREIKGGSNVVSRGAPGPGQSPLEEAMIREYQRVLGIDDSEVQAELAGEVVARGPANWEWVQAIGRTIDRRLPFLGNIALTMVSQVDAYFSRSHIAQAVNEIVGPSLAKGPAVVVSHSLGTIVSYLLLRASGDAPAVKLYMTFGSPLGIGTVVNKLGLPRPVPKRVAKWINGTDERDYVALYAKLEPQNWPAGIENLTDLHNRKEDAHLITDYLAHDKVARAIHAALT